jgi:hypothetical protein
MAFQDNNVRAQALGLNLQHKPSSFPIFELLLIESAEHNPRNFTAASRIPLWLASDGDIKVKGSVQ